MLHEPCAARLNMKSNAAAKRSLTMYKTIKIDKANGVWRVTLNRPEIKNAHDLNTFKELVQAFDEVERDPECRCAVLTGSGDFFCAGQDLQFTRSADAR